MNFFDIIKTIYQKDRRIYDHTMQLNITLNKWLGFDPHNIAIIKNLMPYMFYIETKHYYYLLYFGIPKRMKVPFFKKIPKEKEKESKLFEKLRYVLGWSKRELEFQRPILDALISSNEKYWKKELGVK